MITAVVATVTRNTKARLTFLGAWSVDRAMSTTENTDPQVSNVRESILDKLGRKVSDRRYCDIGPHAGEWRVHVGTLYLTDDELRAIDHL
jgi:hypothetical protein